MPRLLRPYIPLETRCRVVLRQLGEMWPDDVINSARKRPGWIGSLFADGLRDLAKLIGCEGEALHLDHDPPLGARVKVWQDGVHVGYTPDANDPEHLFYRGAAAHRLKTNVRGDGAQRPDRVLIKRQRWLEQGKPQKPKRKWPKRPFPKGKRKIQGRPFSKKGNPT